MPMFVAHQTLCLNCISFFNQFETANILFYSIFVSRWNERQFKAYGLAKMQICSHHIG